VSTYLVVCEGLTLGLGIEGFEIEAGSDGKDSQEYETYPFPLLPIVALLSKQIEISLPACATGSSLTVICCEVNGPTPQ